MPMPGLHGNHDVEEKLDTIITLLETIANSIEQFQKFVLEVTPDAAIEAIEELEEELEG